MSKTIEHTGVIESINGNQIRVKIVQSSACSSCQVKSMCSSSESKEKLSKKEKLDMIDKLTKEMNSAARNLDFERAMELRDIIFELESE